MHHRLTARDDMIFTSANAGKLTLNLPVDFQHSDDATLAALKAFDHTTLASTNHYIAWDGTGFTAASQYITAVSDQFSFVEGALNVNLGSYALSDDVNAGVTGLSDRIGTLEGATSGYAATSDVTTVQDNLNAGLTGVSGRLDTLEGATSNYAVASDITSLYAGITGVQDNLDAGLTGIDSRLTTLEGTSEYITAVSSNFSVAAGELSLNTGDLELARPVLVDTIRFTNGVYGYNKKDYFYNIAVAGSAAAGSIYGVAVGDDTCACISVQIFLSGSKVGKINLEACYNKNGSGAVTLVDGSDSASILSSTLAGTECALAISGAGVYLNYDLPANCKAIVIVSEVTMPHNVV